MNDQKFKKWDKWLNYIIFDTELLLKHHYFFNEFKKIIKQNSKIQKLNQFIDWIRDSHLYSSTVTIGRFLDRHKDSISLFKLLNDIKKILKFYREKDFL